MENIKFDGYHFVGRALGKFKSFDDFEKHYKKSAFTNLSDKEQKEKLKDVWELIKTKKTHVEKSPK